MSFCSDPNGYHEHSCPGYTLERIADALERLVDVYAPTEEERAKRAEDEAFAESKKAVAKDWTAYR